MGKINPPDFKTYITTSMYGIGGRIDTKINGTENPEIHPTNITMCEMLRMLPRFLKESTKYIILYYTSVTLGGPFALEWLQTLPFHIFVCAISYL